MTLSGDIFLGKVSKGVGCSAKGCSDSAVKSLSKNKLIGSGIEISGERRVYLCRSHYKELKKSSKKVDDIERLRWKG
jgi:hypothetical protein|tara:strand:+ start:1109 stop:1339 length:231 start_codon:yes stop_codon:yes gene_type:complete